jgi:hypothetical protein
MVFVPEGQHDSSQARSALPQRGWRTQPRISTLSRLVRMTANGKRRDHDAVGRLADLYTTWRERRIIGKHRSVQKNTGWKPMLHWFSGLLSDL